MRVKALIMAVMLAGQVYAQPEGLIQLSYIPATGHKYTKEHRLPFTDNSQSLSYRYTTGVYIKGLLLDAVYMGWGMEYTKRGYDFTRDVEDDYGNPLGRQQDKYIYTSIDFPLLFDYAMFDQDFSPWLTVGMSNQIVLKYEQKHIYSKDFSGYTTANMEIKGFEALQAQYYRIYIPGIVVGMGTGIALPADAFMGIQLYSRTSLRLCNHAIHYSEYKLFDLGCHIALFLPLD